MPAIGKPGSAARHSKDSFLQKFYEKYVNLKFIKQLVFDPSSLPIVAVLILLTEFVLNVVVIHRVPYTEIDWIAYMQECEGFLNGTTNYALLKGDTGPLVYPAAFVYIYSIFYYVTNHGQNIRLAQYIFIGIYLLQMWLVLRLYTKSRKVPPYVLVISAFTSYRIHSIYVLRLFNDPIAVLFLYAALNLFVAHRWTLGSVFFSLGVGIKMNILLYAPALLLFYLTNLGLFKTIIQLAICGFLQLLIGAPFLLTYPLQYFKGSFDLGRIFEHKWTVNYRFLPREIFENKMFHLGLLLLHLVLLFIFAKPSWRFFKSYLKLRALQQQLQPQINRKNQEIDATKQPKKIHSKVVVQQEEKLTPEQAAFLKSFEKGLQKSTGLKAPQVSLPKETNKAVVEEKVFVNFDQCIQLALLPLFLCNFIGLMCARSLHYQFYVWYFHSLPYLVWSTGYSLGTRFLILGVIEYCWNTYPSTNFSSVSLHMCHIILLVGVARTMFKTVGQSDAVRNQNLQQEKPKDNLKNGRNKLKST